MRFVAGRGAATACRPQRRRGEAVAGRGPSAQRTAGRDAAAKSHREDVAGRKCHGGAAGRECHSEEDGGTVAESHREELPAGAPWQSCWPGEPWKTVGSGHGNKLRQGKQSAGRDAPSGRRCRPGRCSEEPSGSKQGKSPSCRQGKSTPCCKRTKKRAAKPTLLSPL